MRYVVRVSDPADGSVHVYRFSSPVDADQFANVMRKMGGEVEITPEETGEQTE